jgi:hypothetical protein
VLPLLLISSWPPSSICQASSDSPSSTNITTLNLEVMPSAARDQSSNGAAGSSSNNIASSSSPNPRHLPSPSPNPDSSPSPAQDADVSSTNQSAASPSPSAEANSSSGVNGSSGSSSGRLTNWDLSRQIVQDIGDIKANVFNFWQTRGPDTEFGGFHGEHSPPQ